MARSSECFSKEQIVAAILEIDEGRTRPKDSGSFDYALDKDGFILLCWWKQSSHKYWSTDFSIFYQYIF